MLAESKHDETKSALSHLVELAEAGRRGVIAAREKISGAMHDSTNLPTYNQNGAMEVSNLSIKKPMRF